MRMYMWRCIWCACAYYHCCGARTVPACTGTVPICVHIYWRGVHVRCKVSLANRGEHARLVDTASDHCYTRACLHTSRARTHTHTHRDAACKREHTQPIRTRIHAASTRRSGTASSDARAAIHTPAMIVPTPGRGKLRMPRRIRATSPRGLGTDIALVRLMMLLKRFDMVPISKRSRTG